MNETLGMRRHFEGQVCAKMLIAVDRNMTQKCSEISSVNKDFKSSTSSTELSPTQGYVRGVECIGRSIETSGQDEFGQSGSLSPFHTPDVRTSSSAPLKIGIMTV